MSAPTTLPGLLPGLEVLRKDFPKGTLRLVALSGYGQDEDRKRTRAAGFDHHLVKPVDPAALKAALGAWPHA